MARGRSGRRTDYSWLGVNDIASDVDIGGAAQFLGTATTFGSAGTLVRIRGRAFAQLDTGGINERATLILGLGVFQNDAVLAGIAPEFNTDGASSEYSWIWTGALFVSSCSEAAIVDDSLFDRIEIDTKAMRRIKPNEVLAMVIEAPAAGALDQTGTIDVMVQYRALLGN